MLPALCGLVLASPALDDRVAIAAIRAPATRKDDDEPPPGEPDKRAGCRGFSVAAMKTFDYYILRKTVGPLSAAIGIVLVALLLERLVRLLDLVVNQGGPFFLLLKMLVNLVPTYLGLALPAAFFVGVLMAAIRLSSDSELDAIQASGVGLFRLLIPIMGLAVVLMVCSVMIIGFMQPYTRYAYRALVYLVTNTAWDAALERGAFFTGFGGKTILIEDISEAGHTLSGLFIS